MSWSVHLKDRKAAYHVPNRQATDICHLQSFISLLPASVPPNAHTRTHTHSVLLAQCPHFQSISATYLSHHSNCSLQHSSFLYGGNEKNETRGKGESEDGGDDPFIWEDSYVLKGAALAAKNFPLTRVQLILWNGCPLSRSDGTIPLVCRLGDESVMLRTRERRMCRCCLKTPDITCSRYLGCFIDFHPLPPHHRQCRPRCQPRRHHHYLHKHHSSSSSSSFLRHLKCFHAPIL